MYKCIIIDDEPHAIEGLKNYIETIPELKIVATYTDPVIALREIHEAEPVDLILMDVDMPKLTGLELSKEIRNKTKKLVFTTAHTKHAYDAYQVNADDYLLKPYSLGKFVITFNKLFPKNEQVINNDVGKDYFFVKSKEDNLKMIRVKYADIVAVESKQNYILIHTMNKNIFAYMSLTEIANILTTYSQFIRVQRSFLINTEFIELIDGNNIKMKTGLEITVGDSYRKEFHTFVHSSLIKAGKRN
jgi:DNA-binding LytR/AlgR family response regulator